MRQFYPSLPVRVASAFMLALASIGGIALPARAETTAVQANELLDIDGNGTVDALSDGLLLMRYMFGLRGQQLILGAIGNGAARTTPSAIEAYIGSLYTNPPGGGGGGGGTTTAPSNCTLSQIPDTSIAPATPGTIVTLTASCNSGSAPSACSWNNGITATTCSVNVPAPAQTTAYTAVASNSGGSSPMLTTTVNVAAAGGGGGGQSFCTGPHDEIADIGWPASGQGDNYASGFKDQVIAYRLTVPVTFNPPLDITHLGFMRIVEQPGQTTTGREVTVSKNACDFQSGHYLYNDLGAGDTAPYVSFATNNPNGYQQIGAMMNVNSGDVIYFNIRNRVNGSPTCSYPTCDVILQIATPNRY